MPVPSNIDPASAIDISSLPYSNSQQVDDGGTTYSVWYKYTAVSPNIVLGAWGFGDLVTYTPAIGIYEGLSNANSSILYLNISSNNAPIQFPVTVGNTYYFQFITNFGNPSPANLEVSVVDSPNEIVPIGSIIINDDTVGFPAVILDVDNDDTVLQFKSPFAAGEGGSILPSGISLFSNYDDSTLKLYDDQLNLLATIVPFVSTSDFLISNDGVDTFYVADVTSGKVTTISDTGVVGGTIWTLPISVKLAGMAVSLDETILYYTVKTAGSDMHRWDLINDIALSDLSTGVVNHFYIFDILVLDDGTIVTGYQKNTSVKDYFIRQFDDTGATLNTYNSSSTIIINRIAHAIDNPNSFWAWSFIADNHSKFENIKVSDGSILKSFTGSIYETGIYGPAANATPARFGHSSSCPFIVLRVEIPVSGPTNPILEIAKIHTGDFTQGQAGATYDVTVTNTGDGPTSGTVTVTETVPTGLQFVSMSGSGWVCVGNVCSRDDALAPGMSYPVITVTVNVDVDAPASVINLIGVTGEGGPGEDTDTTVINLLGEPGGIYFIEYGSLKTNDTLWVAFPDTTIDVEIPNPHIETAYIGGE